MDPRADRKLLKESRSSRDGKFLRRVSTNDGADRFEIEDVSSFGLFVAFPSTLVGDASLGEGESLIGSENLETRSGSGGVVG